ncbi:MAG: rRNA maturation RNase YbeY [Candidatus Jettenia sp.]|nr:rRNA maturation RNase YbeY [Candidatus Jettenia sp.]
MVKLEIIDLQEFSPINKSWVKRLLKAILKMEGKNAELNIVFVDNKRIKEINKAFLGHNYATDVLSFAYNEPFLSRNSLMPYSQCKTNHLIPSDEKEKNPLPEDTIIGEIIISVELAKKIAQKRRYEVEGEIALYLIHGLLHLLGYDDKQKKEAKEMHRREKELLLNFGYSIPVPN